MSLPDCDCKGGNRMFRQAVRRALALLLALCLLPAAALGQAASPAEEWPVDSSAVTRADFDLSVQLHADAFPADGLTDYQGWETLLSKLRLSGVMDLQRFPRPNNRMYMEAQILLNDRELTRFSFEDYWGFRYVRSPALCNRSIHFQMDNYLEFMLKPYDYYELPTQYISLLTYPEVTAYLAESYEDALTPYFHGEGSRTISYDDLYQLCQDMDAVMTEARAEQSYFFLLSLLIDLGMADQVYDGLSCLEDYLDWLDPEQEGMTITVEGDTDRYEVGGRTLFTRTRGEGELVFRLSLPTENDEELTLEYDQTPGANGGMDVNARLTVSVQEETLIDLTLNADGLPKETDTQSTGTLNFAVSGSAVEEAACAFRFRLTRSAAQPPFHVTFGADWLHPETEKPAVTLLYSADVEMKDESVLEDRIYDNQNDFFHLNDTYLEEYKRDFTLPLALTCAPLLMETPSGVLNDILRFCDETGILATLGIE